MVTNEWKSAMVCHGMARRVLTWPAFPWHAVGFETCPVLPCVHPADALRRGLGDKASGHLPPEDLFCVEGMGQ